MATHDISPSLIIGQQWSALADIMTSSTENVEDKVDKDGNNSNSRDTSMKLGRQEMSLFGFCPSQDEFSLVVCEKCNLLVKPQALKQHIESRHGPTNLSSLGSISASVLNSELGKKLLMHLPMKPTPPPPSTTSSEKQSGSFKPLSFIRPPTKASLKQVPVPVKSNSTPLFGGGMKINITKPVKSGNRVAPTKPAPVTSNPVVKMEKLEKLSTTSSPSSLLKPSSQPPESVRSELSKNILYLSSTKISTLVNGSIKSVISLITTSSASTTTSSSIVSNPMLVAVTKTSTDTPLSSRNVTTFVNTPSLTKPLLAAPIMTIGPTHSVAPHPVPVAKSIKASKDQKERKFLPCKDREYDADKHCGVLISETGKSCTRSLTCKTHALSLRRAVSGRCKSFDDLLKEHKAAKEAILKAKAESQNTTTSVPTKKVLVSPATINSTLNALKQQMKSVISQHDGKIGYSPGAQGNARALLASNALSTAATSFVKPQTSSDVFQRFTSSAVLPPAITVKEEVAAPLQGSTATGPSLSSPEQSHSTTQSSKLDPNFVSHHPRPMASNTFGGRLNDKGCLLFSRKMDYVRAALLSALERQLNPPPHKKLCVESNLPKELQTLVPSQDPYEFNLVDTSAGGTLNSSPTLLSASKPLIKPKSKLPTSPIAASLANSQSFSLCSVAASMSLSASPLSTLCTTQIEVPTLSPSGLALNWPIKSWDGTTSYSPSASPSPILSSHPNPVSRKRSGSSNGQLVAVACSNGNLPVSPGVSLCLTTTNTTGALCQQSGIMGLITPASLSSHQTGHLIAIPSVSLANANFAQRTTSTLGPTKITASTSAAFPITAHKNNNIFKDFNLVLTGIDPCLVNGQYVNITGAQLTELTTGQGQTLFLNSFTPGRSNCSSVSDTTLGMTSPTSRPAKRSRSSASKSHPTLISSVSKSHPTLISSVSKSHPTLISSASKSHCALISSVSKSYPTLISSVSKSHQTLISSVSKSHPTLISSVSKSHPMLISSAPKSHPTLISSAPKSHPTLINSDSKIPASALEGYKLVPTSGVLTSDCLPSNAVLMDGGRLQEAMLSLTEGNTPTYVAIASSSASTNCTGNSMQVLCADSSSLVSSSTLVNGASQSAHDKFGSNSQRHHHSSSSETHHHHHQHHNKTQHQPELVLGSVLQGSPSIAVPIPSTSVPQLCSSQTLFKPVSTLNLAAKNMAGKLTMQPVSLTFPISVNQAGLAALTLDKPQQHQQQQHTLLVTTSGSNAGSMDPASVLMAGKPDLHLQSQISNSSTGNLIS